MLRRSGPPRPQARLCSADGGLGLPLQTLASATAAAHSLGPGKAEVRGPTPPPQEQPQLGDTRPE